MKRSTRQTGFTLIEVLMSLVVFMVAVVGLVGLQRISVEGAEKSMQHTAATNIAQYYLNQLRTEIGTWRVNASATNCGEAFPDGDYNLCTIQTCCTDIAGTTDSPWEELTANGNTFRQDPYFGHQTIDDFDSIYCVNYKLRPLDVPVGAPPTAVQTSQARIWLVRVLVVWPKKGQYDVGGAGAWQDCTPGTIAARVALSEVVELVGTATREFAP